MRHIVLLLALSFLLLFAPVPASAAVDPDLAPAVRQAEIYLKNLKTARARFLQTAPDGSQLLGTFYLSRPGKLRFEYDDPVKDFVVADGFFIYFYDAQLGQQTNAPIGQTLADFLLRSDLSFSGAITVGDAQRGGGLLQVTLVQTADPEAGSITLGFTEDPLPHLRKWRVTDATGAVTEVELFKAEEGLSLDSGLFKYLDPKGPKVYNN